MTNSAISDANAAIDHNIDRFAELRGTNHAEMVAWTCRRCHAGYDVGVERLHAATFDSLCCDCFATTRKDQP